MARWKDGESVKSKDGGTERRREQGERLAPLPRSILASFRFSFAAAILLTAWLLLSGGLLAVRTLAHATNAIEVGPYFAAGAGLAFAASLTRAAWNRGRKIRPRSALATALPLVATSLGLLLWGACLTRRTALPAAVIFWLVLCGEEAWAWRRQLKADRRPVSSGRSARTAPGDLLIQQFTRLLTPEGEDIVRGSLIVTVDRDSRSAAGHVAFCPPFSQRPQFDVQPAKGEDANLMVSQLCPHGARIEVKLTQPAKNGAAVSVRFVARARCEARDSV